VAPATGGGGTAGFQDPLLLALGGAAILAGAGSISYRRRVLRRR
jgi:LPXTG-motif cell wall-anchored protein